MGQKIPPYAQRIGINKQWKSRWYMGKGYSKTLHNDLAIREFLEEKIKKSGIAEIVIERTADFVTITALVAKPGLIIGKGGKNVDELKKELEKIAGSKVRLNIQEVDEVYKYASLVAQEISYNIERRISYRRAMKQVIRKVMEAGAKGVKVMCSGRLNGAEIARREWLKDGAIPLHTLRADIDYGQALSETTFGTIGIKVWIYKGEVL